MLEGPNTRSVLGQNISDILSRSDFKEIVRFVLTNGDRKTYFNMYSNNPHYMIGVTHIYLNPVSQWINACKDELSMSVDDYNEIYVENRASLYWPYRIVLFEGEVWIADFSKKNTEKYENTIRSEYVPILKEMIGKYA